MKIDAETITVLKSFSNINPSILIKEGNVLETVSSTRTIKATAKILTNFPRRCAFYSVNKFISTLSLFNDPEIEFGDKSLTISDGLNSVQLTYSDENSIIKPPDREIKLPSIDVSFTVTNDHIKSVEKALGILSVPNIVFRGKGGKVYLQAVDMASPTSDFYSVELGDTDKDFCAIYRSENIKMLPGDYNVEICSKGISRFFNDDVEYFITVEQTSKF